MIKKIFDCKQVFAVMGVGFGVASLPMIPAQAQQAQPVSGQTLTLGQKLAERGVSFQSSYIGNIAANPTGGAKSGNAYAGQVAIGTKLDLEKLIGLPGASVQAVFIDRTGSDLNKMAINNSIGPQAFYGGGETYHLAVLTYTQKLFADKVELMLGRSSLGRYVLTDPIYAHFMSAAIQGTPPVTLKNTNTPSTQTPVWMGMVTLKPTLRTYLSVSVSENNPVTTEPQYHGVDFSFSGENGAIGWLELGYNTNFKTSDYPSRYDIGLVVDRTPYHYPLYLSGHNKLGAGTAYGRTMPYVQLRQMVYRPSLNSEEGLTMFGFAGIGTSHLQAVHYTIGGGASYQGAIPGRPDDFTDFMISDTNYQERYIDQYYQYRVNALQGTQKPYQHMVMMEVNYIARLTPWLNVMPNLQYIVHPDGMGFAAYPKRNLPNAVVVGLEFNINLAGLAGLS